MEPAGKITEKPGNSLERSQQIKEGQCIRSIRPGRSNVQEWQKISLPCHDVAQDSVFTPTSLCV